MKPKDWDIFDEKEKGAHAIGRFHSARGRYIISQALYYAVKELKKAKYPEQNNIEDMEIFRETLFNFPDEVFK